MSRMMNEEWVPRTRLGHEVHNGEIKNLDELLSKGVKLREVGMIDFLAHENGIKLEDFVLDVNMVQRMTDSGRRVKFRAVVAVGNRDGFVGLGVAKDAQVGPAIRKAITVAKTNMIKVKRGCGSWECRCGENHSLPIQVEGSAGSVKAVLIPAPVGLGLVTGGSAKMVMEFAGIKDIWTRTEGQTRTTMNFAKAIFEALKQTNFVKMKDRGTKHAVSSQD